MPKTKRTSAYLRVRALHRLKLLTPIVKLHRKLDSRPK